MLKQRDHEIERADRLDRYSPFQEKGVLGKFFALAGGGGGGALIGNLVQQLFPGSDVLLAALILVGGVLGLFAFDRALDYTRNRMIKRTESQFPVDLVQVWRSQTMVNYRKVLRQFLLAAIKVREEWYPDLATLKGQKVFGTYRVPHIHFHGEPDLNPEALNSDDLDVELDRIIDRHMALG